MELFHLYIDSDESESYGWSKLILPFCRTSKGYGLFYWPISDGGSIIAVDYLKHEPHGWFENNSKSIDNYDKNMGRWSKNKLREASNTEYIVNAIIQIFESKEMQDTMKMWSKI